MRFTQIHLVLLAIIVCSCKSTDRRHSTTEIKPEQGRLECRRSVSGQPILSAFSFQLGRSVNRAKDGDLFFYFDQDDCEGGALVGRYDEKGWLFSIGHQEWQKLQEGEHPPSPEGSVEVITPITKAHEGYAFWLKTTSGRYAIVRIVSVQSATFGEIARGKTAAIEFEWMWR